MAPDTDTDDPRVTGNYIRRLPGEADTCSVTLVGVVHNHPASKHRVRSIVDAVDPAVLALELPPLAVPLYEGYVDDGRTPPQFGGEMSAAVQAAATERVVGIDGPSPRFVVRLLRNLLVGTASVETSWSVLQSLSPVTKRVIICRLAAVLAVRAELRLEVDSPISHDCDWSDDPQTQASDEQAQVDQAQTMAKTFEQSGSARIRDITRNQHMASRLSTLRQDGAVVAVVGIAHLDPLAGRLSGRAG